MAKPVILTLDDEVQVLNAIERDLRTHYGKDYRIVKATSPTLALEALEQLKKRNDQVALLLVDQRMPEMEGTEFLTQALRLFPEAKKVLLTAYADTGAAITAINDIGLDHYLMKPWISVGDVRQGVVRRVAAAVGQGSTAISFVHQYLKTV